MASCFQLEPGSWVCDYPAFGPPGETGKPVGLAGDAQVTLAWTPGKEGSINVGQSEGDYPKPDPIEYYLITPYVGAQALEGVQTSKANLDLRPTIWTVKGAAERDRLHIHREGEEWSWIRGRVRSLRSANAVGNASDRAAPVPAPAAVAPTASLGVPSRPSADAKLDANAVTFEQPATAHALGCGQRRPHRSDVPELERDLLGYREFTLGYARFLGALHRGR